MREQRSPQRQPQQCGICAARGDDATGLVATCRECADSSDHVKCLQGAYETVDEWYSCFDDDWMCPACTQRAGVAAILEAEEDTEWPEFVQRLVQREQKAREERRAGADMAALDMADVRSVGDVPEQAAVEMLRRHVDAAIQEAEAAAVTLRELEDRFAAANEARARLTLDRERGVAIMERIEDELAEVDVDLEVVRQQLMNEQALEAQAGVPVGSSAGVRAAERAVLEHRAGSMRH